MSSRGEITRWLEALKAGDREAAQPLWERYFDRLVRLARERLRGLPRAASDEEDIALSAFDSFCRRAEQGTFPRLDNRDDLWQVLVLIVGRKVCDRAEYERRGKRDWRRTRPMDDTVGQEPPGTEPDPATAAEVAEELRRLLSLLPGEGMRAIAVRKLEGHTNEEIARLQGCSLATVERRLALIRKYWLSGEPCEGSGGGKGS
jgi:DNA-directed RNA polymerase specialized sigma24 family protein